MAKLAAMLAAIDFTRFGTSARSLLVLLRDTSPSEMVHEKEFSEGGNAIAPTALAIPQARNFLDIAFCYGDDRFQLEWVGPARDFRMPGTVEYGAGTEAAPWLTGIRELVTAYKAHLATLGIDVRTVVVVIASDFMFCDDYEAELERWVAFQKETPNLVVVPAGFGAWTPHVARRFSEAVPPVDLNSVQIAPFIRVVSQTVSQATRESRPAEAVTRELSRLAKNPRKTAE